MAWRVAKSLETLRKQINTAAPNRSKISDGTIGNAEHSARLSDHNPDSDGVVKAMDITHDPRNGVDSQKLAEVLVASRDLRIKYLISNRKICSSTTSPWKWRKYTGSNPHDKHVHISVKPAKNLYNSTAPWAVGPLPPISSAPAVVAYPILKRRSSGADVKKLQRLLGIEQDGKFGVVTLKSVIEFQKANGLAPDGIVGQYTWTKLNRR